MHTDSRGRQSRKNTAFLVFLDCLAVAVNAPTHDCGGKHFCIAQDVTKTLRPVLTAIVDVPRRHAKGRTELAVWHILHAHTYVPATKTVHEHHFIYLSNHAHVPCVTQDDSNMLKRSEIDTPTRSYAVYPAAFLRLGFAA